MVKAGGYLIEPCAFIDANNWVGISSQFVISGYVGKSSARQKISLTIIFNLVIFTGLLKRKRKWKY